MRLLIAVDESGLAVELHLVGGAGLCERRGEDVALAGDFEEGWLELLERGDDELVNRHVAVEHDVACAEVGLDRLEVDSSDGAVGLAEVRVLDEDSRQRALERGVDDDGAGLGLLDTARGPDLLHQIENLVLGELRGLVSRGRGIGGDRGDQAASLARRGVGGGLGEDAGEERLLDVSSDFLELLLDLPSKLIGRHGAGGDLRCAGAGADLTGRAELRVGDRDGFLMDLEHVASRAVASAPSVR